MFESCLFSRPCTLLGSVQLWCLHYMYGVCHIVLFMDTFPFAFSCYILLLYSYYFPISSSFKVHFLSHVKDFLVRKTFAHFTFLTNIEHIMKHFIYRSIWVRALDCNHKGKTSYVHFIILTKSEWYTCEILNSIAFTDNHYHHPSECNMRSEVVKCVEKDICEHVIYLIHSLGISSTIKNGKMSRALAIYVIHRN